MNLNLNNNIESLDKRFCNGCECCAQICPNSAIKMVEDENGFFYPSVDSAKCNYCGLCVKGCSNHFNKFNKKQKHVYAFNGQSLHLVELFQPLLNMFYPRMELFAEPHIKTIFQ